MFASPELDSRKSQFMSDAHALKTEIQNAALVLLAISLQLGDLIWPTDSPGRHSCFSFMF